MKKRLLSLLCALALLLGALPSAAALEGESRRAAETLTALHVLPDSSKGLDQPITREEAAVMLARFAGLTGEGGAWSDAEETSPWARQAVGQVLAAGLMETDGGAFRPQAGMTRAEGEAAALLAGNRARAENK